MLTELSYKNFSNFKMNLIFYSRRFNISFEDTEEIVNDSILKALDYFDHEKGSFEALCKVIIKNKIFNFKRDNIHLFLLILLDENEVLLKADEVSIEDKENNILALKFINKLNEFLDDDEARLINEMYKSCGTSNKLSISKASIKIGMLPSKGWDIFRKIQRKAKKLQEKLEKTNEEIYYVSERKTKYATISNFQLSSYNPPESNQVSLKVNRDKDLRFYLNLSKIQIEKLNSIYNYSQE